MAINIGSQRYLTKNLVSDPRQIVDTDAELDNQFNCDGFIKYSAESETFYGKTPSGWCVLGKWGQTGGGGTSASIATYAKTVTGSEFQPVTVDTEVAYYEVTVDAATHKLTEVIVGRLCDAGYDEVDAVVSVNEATKLISIKTYATEQPSGSYILILKGVQ